MQSQSYRLIHEDHPDSIQERILFEGLNAEAFRAKGFNPMRTFGIFIKDQADQIVGGATGLIYYGCLYVDMLWLQKELRYQGWGSQLMLEAEKIGKEKKCSFATVNTMDWEAVDFYQKLGYQIEYIREGYDKNSKMYFLRKSL